MWHKQQDALWIGYKVAWIVRTKRIKKAPRKEQEVYRAWLERSQQRVNLIARHLGLSSKTDNAVKQNSKKDR